LSFFLRYNCWVIRWQDLDPAKVERAVQALVRRLHPLASSIDGAGGDRGRDVIWHSPDGLVIFEIKSYTRRLTNSAKRKIATSLRNAAAHRPVRWCLIVPLNPSPAELTWFDELRRRYPDCALEWRGRDWLDAQFAEHEDLRRLVEGSTTPRSDRRCCLASPRPGRRGGSALAPGFGTPRPRSAR
jgi:hypothetical protein